MSEELKAGQRQSDQRDGYPTVLGAVGSRGTELEKQVQFGLLPDLDRFGKTESGTDLRERRLQCRGVGRRGFLLLDQAFDESHLNRIVFRTIAFDQLAGLLLSVGRGET